MRLCLLAGLLALALRPGAAVPLLRVLGPSTTEARARGHAALHRILLPTQEREGDARRTLPRAVVAVAGWLARYPQALLG